MVASPRQLRGQGAASSNSATRASTGPRPWLAPAEPDSASADRAGGQIFAVIGGGGSRPTMSQAASELREVYRWLVAFFHPPKRSLMTL